MRGVKVLAVCQNVKFEGRGFDRRAVCGKRGHHPLLPDVHCRDCPNMNGFCFSLMFIGKGSSLKFQCGNSGSDVADPLQKCRSNNACRNGQRPKRGAETPTIVAKGAAGCTRGEARVIARVG